MIDINFYMNVHHITKKVLRSEALDRCEVVETLEKFRAEYPIVYNIETTNACNMKCKMCPRTTKMTRNVEIMDYDTFDKVIKQLRPFTVREWEKWKGFIVSEYGIQEDEMSENHFFLYIIPKVIQLHGYGDPLLDKNMAKFVKLLSRRGFFSYFSCNPANIHIDRTVDMFKSGLNFVKYSIESTDDKVHKDIRGDTSGFSKNYANIYRLLEIKEKCGYKTVIIITMLNLNLPNQKEEYQRLKEAFKDLDVYLYLKSEDQQWYREDYHGTNSVHWTEFCRHPWMSATIKSNGDVAMCMEDYNNEIILGNVKYNCLYDIWNGDKYRQFREDHFNLSGDIKCLNECDMKIIGEFI